MRVSTACAISLGVAVLIGNPFLVAAKNPKPAVPEPDRIDVIAQIPITGGPVVQFTSGVHWSRNYLYMDKGITKPIEILDVTDPSAPKDTGQFEVPKPEANGALTAVVGTAALIASSTPAVRTQTVTMMSFADPEHPQVLRSFPGVTALLKDSARGLVYLADGNSLWVLQLQPAADAELQKEYDHYVLYSH